MQFSRVLYKTDLRVSVQYDRSTIYIRGHKSVIEFVCPCGLCNDIISLPIGYLEGDLPPSQLWRMSIDRDRRVTLSPTIALWPDCLRSLGNAFSIDANVVHWETRRGTP